jgi:DNA mismatch repair protein MutS2
MIEHTYQVLGYYRLLEIMSRYASCPLGRSECLSLTPSNDIKKITHELSLVSETRLLLKIRGFLTFADLTDLKPFLARSRVRGAHLEAEELLTVLRLAESGQTARGFLRSEKSLYPGLAAIIDDMPDLDPLVKQLKSAIAPNGDIRDSATPLLAKIRHQRRKQRSHLEKKLDDIRRSKDLGRNSDDHLVTVRDGRYVISVRSDQKSLFGGIVHDYSRTKATCFVEPMEVISDNNRSAELALEERAEEHRIRVALTRAVRDMTPEIIHAQGLIARLDSLYARARYGEDFSCVAPEIDDGQGVRLKEAKNPILLALSRIEGKEGEHRPVAVDITLEQDRNLLIVSGPNRGGKTVTLKTLGLMTLMTQTGIHIPAAEGSCLPVFDHCVADIGDDQDIQTGLSTFSAHAAHLKRIIELADQKSLVIIDEPGMGTDPNEGAALTMAVLDELSQRGVFVALATHLNRLKAYGLLNRRVLNAAVEFDTQCNRPTFRLRYGSPGISHALETARDLGMPMRILEKARGYLDQDDVQLNRLIEKMHRLIVRVEAEKKEAENAKQGHHSAAEDIRARLAQLEIEKQTLMETYRADAEAAIRSAREELKQAINLLKRKRRPVQSDVTKRCEAVRQELLAHFESPEDAPAFSVSGELREGQRVFHTRLKQHGVVQSVGPSGGRASVMLGAVKISADSKDLQVVAKPKEVHSDTKPRSVNWTFKERTPLKSPSGGLKSGELNVVGYRVDDAIPLIDRAVDRALVEGELSLTIIHGYGTGRLRGAIRDHLRGMPFIKTVNSADPKLGGDGVTIAEIG